MSEVHKTMPAVYHHCEAVYKAMSEEAQQVPDKGLVYTGYTTKLFRHLGLSVPHYTAVMSHLKRMDCIRQIYRGGGGQPSQWLILQPPTEQMYDSAPGQMKATRMDHIQGQQIRDLNQRLNDMERDWELKFAQLEAKIGA